MAELAANPVFTDPEWHDLSRDQTRERTISRLRAAYKLLIRDGADVARRNARLEIHALHDLGMCSSLPSSLPPSLPPFFPSYLPRSIGGFVLTPSLPPSLPPSP